MNLGRQVERLRRLARHSSVPLNGSALATTLRRGLRCLLPGLAVLALVSTPGCRYPRDIEHSLERIQGGVMHVGVTENPPWVIRTSEGPAGVEPELIRSLAQRLDAEVQWHWGSESELILALAERQLDIAVGGLVKKSALSKIATFSRPYFQSHFSVGFPPRSRNIPDSLQGIKVQLSPIDPIAEKLRQQGAVPVAVARYDATMPVAAPTWQLLAHGFQPGPWTLDTAQHVVALPPGENAWILTVQRHLDGDRHLEQRLRQLEAGDEN